MSPLEYTNGLEKIVRNRGRLYLFDTGVFQGGYTEIGGEINETVRYVRSYSKDRLRETSHGLDASLFLLRNFPNIRATQLVISELHDFQLHLANYNTNQDRESRRLLREIVHYLQTHEGIVPRDSGLEEIENFLIERFTLEHPDLPAISRTDANLVTTAFHASVKEKRTKPTDIVTTDSGVYLALASMYENIMEAPGLTRKQAHKARKKCVRLYCRRKDEDFSVWFDSASRKQTVIL